MLFGYFLCVMKWVWINNVGLGLMCFYLLGGCFYIVIVFILRFFVVLEWCILSVSWNKRMLMWWSVDDVSFRSLRLNVWFDGCDSWNVLRVWVKLVISLCLLGSIRFICGLKISDVGLNLFWKVFVLFMVLGYSWVWELMGCYGINFEFEYFKWCWLMVSYWWFECMWRE